MMNQDEFKNVVAQNLVYYRKLNGYTQLQLAEYTNYSDKAISKWERGESLPDVFVLQQLAELYKITLNDLLIVERKVNVPTSRTTKIFITLISFIGVWFIAALLFFLFWVIPDFLPQYQSQYWMAFIYAIPISFLVVFILTTIWFRDTPIPFLSLSVVAWTAGVSLHISLRPLWDYMWIIYIVLTFVQVLIVLAYWLFNVRKQKNLSIFLWLKGIFVAIGRWIKNSYQRITKSHQESKDKKDGKRKKK